MIDTYILDGKIPVECHSLEQWAKSFETTNRHVGDDIFDTIRVSTIFMGLDHSFGNGLPLLFETMIFGGLRDGYQTRCSTWEEAEEMHKAAVALVHGKSEINNS